MRIGERLRLRRPSWLSRPVAVLGAVLIGLGGLGGAAGATLGALGDAPDSPGHHWISHEHGEADDGPGDRSEH